MLQLDKSPPRASSKAPFCCSGMALEAEAPSPSAPAAAGLHVLHGGSPSSRPQQQHGSPTASLPLPQLGAPGNTSDGRQRRPTKQTANVDERRKALAQSTFIRASTVDMLGRLPFALAALQQQQQQQQRGSGSGASAPSVEKEAVIQPVPLKAKVLPGV